MRSRQAVCFYSVSQAVKESWRATCRCSAQLLLSDQTATTRVFVSRCLPGIIATVFKALSTRKVRSALKLPRSFTPMVRYAKAMTTKSNQFHGSRRYVNGSKMKPLAVTLRQDSNVYIVVNITLRKKEMMAVYLAATSERHY